MLIQELFYRYLKCNQLSRLDYTIIEIYICEELEYTGGNEKNIILFYFKT